MRRDAIPAIARDAQQRDLDAEVLHTLHDGVTFTRGLGDSGYRLEIVDYECPKCGYDRMLRNYSVNPERGDKVLYYCQKPTCPHHVADDYTYVQRNKAHRPVIAYDEPERWDDA